jgi:putative NADH-flavin reductase
MRLALFGPTGGTGRLLIEKALLAGHAVTALARNPSAIAPRPGLTVLGGSVFDPATVNDAVAGHDAVLSALGGRPWRSGICAPAVRNITAAMVQHRVRRIVAISTIGAGDTRTDIGWFPRNVIFRFVLRNEVADKEAMEAQLAATGLDWTVVRVGILANGPARGQFRAADDHSILGMGKIARADVADFMLAQLTGTAWLRRKPVIVY